MNPEHQGSRVLEGTKSRRTEKTKHEEIIRNTKDLELRRVSRAGELRKKCVINLSFKKCFSLRMKLGFWEKN